MKKAFLLFCILFLVLKTQASIRFCSWNIENLGSSKSGQAIAYMAETLKDYDLIAVQEIVAGPGGAQSISRLAEELNRKGAKWDYIVSDPTVSSAYKTERYAYLWKPSRIVKIATWLDVHYQQEIDREPFLGTFRGEGKEFTIVNFHAITKSKQPETEIKYFKFYPGLYRDKILIFAGDFNCPQTHTVFNPLKNMGYLPAFSGQKTTLKSICHQEDCLASEFDNIFYPLERIRILHKGVIHFYKDFNDIKAAKLISDHIPVFIEFSISQ